MKNEIYITTAIPYINGHPHIGHAMDYLIADVLRRYYVSKGAEVRMQAGTDEHGSKIYKKAAAEGLAVQDYVDQNSAIFKSFIHELGAEYTDFIRTTDEDHMRRCQEIWNRLSAHIYKSSYEGWYCEGCESFVSDGDYESNNGICPDHKAEYSRISEENYYLRIADFKDEIRAKIESDEFKITPASRKREFLNLLVDMPDVSISRPKSQVPWGIPVPGDEDQVMYVWIDALSNYITVLGYPDSTIESSWPATIQVIGKDILRFHAGIWPAILLGLNLPLPKNLLSHGFITFNGEKMSKTTGNIVDPIEVIKKHKLDAFRYYFLRHASTTDDADFTWEKYEAAYNELANDFGNLVQRLATLCAKNNVSGHHEYQKYEDADFDARIQNFELNNAFDIVWDRVQGLNRRIDAEKPWALAKVDPTEAKRVLDSMVAELLTICDGLSIFIPQAAQNATNIFKQEVILPPSEPLFPKQ